MVAVILTLCASHHIQDVVQDPLRFVVGILSGLERHKVICGAMSVLTYAYDRLEFVYEDLALLDFETVFGSF
jgi:hypothetical protein